LFLPTPSVCFDFAGSTDSPGFLPIICDVEVVAKQWVIIDAVELTLGVLFFGDVTETSPIFLVRTVPIETEGHIAIVAKYAEAHWKILIF